MMNKNFFELFPAYLIILKQVILPGTPKKLFAFN